MHPWRLLAERPGPSGRVVVVTRDYALDDGRTAVWDVLTEADSVAVLAITPDHQVVLARQFRPGPGIVLDELPGGGVDAGEDPLAAGIRELAEETGYAGQATLLGHTWVNGHSTRRRWAVLVSQAQPMAELNPDESEQIEVVLRPLHQFRDQLRSGQLTAANVAYLGLDHAGLL